MTGILKGYAYTLDAVLTIDGYRAFIFEDRNAGFDEQCIIDLGMRRILKAPREGAYLILESNSELIFEKLEQKEIKLVDHLRSKGIKCRSAANYSKGHYTGWRPMWKQALNGRSAIFSENGYALQNRIWADCFEYSFDLAILRPGWLKIDGEDICLIDTGWILCDLLHGADDFISRVLMEQTDITEEEYYRELTLAGVECISQITEHVWRQDIE
ncbi:MAG: hypothetical protein K6A80_03360 [Saccharofermentans sp.]|nr:hypothetical protein [Saccharofermentans sp.]